MQETDGMMINRCFILFSHCDYLDSSRYPHDFHRDRIASFCYACQDIWPANDGVNTKFHICSKCGNEMSL